MMKSVISSDKHVLNQRERDALHHGPDFRCCETFPECCEIFPVCCEDFPVYSETFPTSSSKLELHFRVILSCAKFFRISSEFPAPFLYNLGMKS